MTATRHHLTPFCPRRYLPYNSHAGSYTWKFLGNVLDMNLTLEENNVPDERELYAKLNLVRFPPPPPFPFLSSYVTGAWDAQPDDFYAPLIHLYFNDDLTVA